LNSRSFSQLQNNGKAVEKLIKMGTGSGPGHEEIKKREQKGGKQNLGAKGKREGEKRGHALDGYMSCKQGNGVALAKEVIPELTSGSFKRYSRG